MRRDYQDTKLQYSIGDALLPYFPVHEVGDRVDMVGAITMISASLRDRVNCKNLDFASTRRTQTWIGHLHNLSSGYKRRPTPGKNNAGTQFTRAPPPIGGGSINLWREQG